jgi:hypothetical protein
MKKSRIKMTNDEEPPYSIQVARALLTTMAGAFGCDNISVEERGQIFTTGLALYRSAVIVQCLSIILEDSKPFMMRQTVRAIRDREIGHVDKYRDMMKNWTDVVLERMQDYRE